MKRTLRTTGRQLLWGMALLIAATAAHAQGAGGVAQWSCWYNDDFSVVCVLAGKPAGADQRGAVDRALPKQPESLRRVADQGVVPEWVRMMQQQPDAFAGRRVTIPLHTHPEDAAFLHQLADSVMCGGNRACRISWLQRPGQLAMATMASAND